MKQPQTKIISMGEYVKYKGKEVKTGTCEHLYYASYQKFKQAFEDGLLRPSDHGVHPERCLRPDSGFLFRFPFPDEDKLPFGDIGQFPFDRGVQIQIKAKSDKESMELTGSSKPRAVSIDLVCQKLVNRATDGHSILTPVFREPVSRKLFRIEDEADVLKIVKQIVRYQIVGEPNEEKRRLYRGIADRILKGMNINPAILVSMENGLLKPKHLPNGKQRKSDKVRKSKRI